MYSNRVLHQIARFTTVFLAKRSMSADCSKWASRIIWIDCEMTGLDLSKHTLVEIAVLVTEGDKQLTTIDNGLNIVIHQPQNVLDDMNDWCKQTFGQNGLLEQIQTSKTSLLSAEDQVLSYVQKHTNRFVCPLAGNSVSVDRQFLQKYMPRLADHLHYRTIDVSTIKEIARRWYPSTYMRVPKKAECHRALDDIKESIQELRWYQHNIMRTDIN